MRNPILLFPLTSPALSVGLPGLRAPPEIPENLGELSQLLWGGNQSTVRGPHSQINAEGASCRAGNSALRENRGFIHLASCHTITELWLRLEKISRVIEFNLVPSPEIPWTPPE